MNNEISLNIYKNIRETVPSAKSKVMDQFYLTFSNTHTLCAELS